MPAKKKRIRKARKQEPKLRHLWAVKTPEHPDDQSNYWIVTRSENIVDAAKKAKAFVKRTDSETPRINSIEYFGTIDT